MKKRVRIMIGLLLLTLLGGLLWLVRTPRGGGPPVTLAVVMNSLSQASDRITFQMRNDGEAAILLTDLVVETNSAAGWQIFSRTQPTNWLGIGTGETKDLQITPPDDARRWRLRVAYGTEVKGPMLLAGKVEFALSHRTWPGRGFGIMQGSNSCISAELSTMPGLTNSFLRR